MATNRQFLKTLNLNNLMIMIRNSSCLLWPLTYNLRKYVLYLSNWKQSEYYIKIRLSFGDILFLKCYLWNDKPLKYQ